MSTVAPSFTTHFTAMLGGPTSRKLAQWRLLLPRIEALEPTLQAESDEQLRQRSLSLRYDAKCGKSLDRMLVEAYALAREAAQRKLGMRHYDVQMLGGIAMHHQCIAEMETGEGKTLTATLPIYLNALPGKGVHLATANDYLAARDAEWMEPVYRMLGMTVGVIQSQMPSEERRKAYQCDITYGTAKEFGFDFLRDQLLLRSIRESSHSIVGRMLGGSGVSHEEPVMRGQNFIIVDEADSLMIDDARTPLIISAIPGAAKEEKIASFQWASECVTNFQEDVHYTWDHKKRQAELNAAGRQLARNLPKPKEMNRVGLQAIYEYVERSILVHREFHLDEQYVVRDDEIVIIDESTGRPAEGRKWRDGIHQAVEAKQAVPVTIDAGQAARITVQDFFLRYRRICGMTGTALPAAREFRTVYQLKVVAVPTHRPSQRKRLEERVFGNEQAKWEAVVAEVREMLAQHRSVLIGTRSIDKSEALSRLLKAASIPHQVLNANHIAAEAKIVEAAGQPGRVTVSTNMAGRGTDIKLSDEVREGGGLHVICTEMHDSARVDRQLIGRCARQGDPGTFRIYLSLEDDLLKRAYGPKKYAEYVSRGRDGQSMDHWRSLFRRAQRKVERKQYTDRKILLYHERERKKMQIQMGQDPYLDSPV